MPETWRGPREIWVYWLQAAHQATQYTDLLNWKKAVIALGLIGLREAASAGAGLRSWPEAIETIGYAVLAYLVLTVLEYLFHLFIYTPVRQNYEVTGKLETAQNREAHFRKELDSCLDKESVRPIQPRQLLNFPTGYKIASHEWMARHPGIQEDLDDCRAEVDRLRKILRDGPQ